MVATELAFTCNGTCNTIFPNNVNKNKQRGMEKGEEEETEESTRKRYFSSFIISSLSSLFYCFSRHSSSIRKFIAIVIFLSFFWSILFILSLPSLYLNFFSLSLPPLQIISLESKTQTFTVTTLFLLSWLAF